MGQCVTSSQKLRKCLNAAYQNLSRNEIKLRNWTAAMLMNRLEYLLQPKRLQYLFNCFLKTGTRPEIFGERGQSIKSTPVCNWYLIYQPRKDERQSRPRWNLNSERKTRNTVGINIMVGWITKSLRNYVVPSSIS
ncbi:uncharacterized protein LOC128248735 isoform X2 [Octopus bimaculoides]|nr:uncharacterized protein LOC128248735 isoform X2 [Octopus bimaculoides]